MCDNQLVVVNDIQNVDTISNNHLDVWQVPGSQSSVVVAGFQNNQGLFVGVQGSHCLCECLRLWCVEAQSVNNNQVLVCNLLGKYRLQGQATNLLRQLVAVATWGWSEDDPTATPLW